MATLFSYFVRAMPLLNPKELLFGEPVNCTFMVLDSVNWVDFDYCRLVCISMNYSYSDHNSFTSSLCTASQVETVAFRLDSYLHNSISAGVSAISSSTTAVDLANETVFFYSFYSVNLFVLGNFSAIYIIYFERKVVLIVLR